MAMNRRQFIIGTTTVIGAGAVVGMASEWLTFLSSNKKGIILGGGKGIMQGQTVPYLSMLDLDKGTPKPEFFALKFMPHGLDFHPYKTNTVVIFEKKGPGACELNLITGRIRTIKTSTDCHFYGHGVYSKDGTKIFATETVLATGEGLISVRDAKDLQIIGQFPTYGKNPHDCKLVDNGRVLAITNGGGNLTDSSQGCVTYVDVVSQKLIDKFEMDDSRFNTGHLDITQDKELVVVSAPRLGLPEDNLGAISVVDQEKHLHALEKPEHIVKRLQAETLSVCIHPEKKIFAATSPRGGFISFWNLLDATFIKSINLDSPRGVILTKDLNHFIISYGAEGSVALVDAKTLSLQNELDVTSAGFSGSHLYLWS